MPDHEGEWTRSSFCSPSQCVEFRRKGDFGQFRDSKDPDGPILQFPAEVVRDAFRALGAPE